MTTKIYIANFSNEPESDLMQDDWRSFMPENEEDMAMPKFSSVAGTMERALGLARIECENDVLDLFVGDGEDFTEWKAEWQEPEKHYKGPYWVSEGVFIYKDEDGIEQRIHGTVVVREADCV